MEKLTIKKKLFLREDLKHYLKANIEENPDTTISTLSYWDDETTWYKKREEERGVYTIEILAERKKIINDKINKLMELFDDNFNI